MPTSPLTYSLEDARLEAGVLNTASSNKGELSTGWEEGTGQEEQEPEGKRVSDQAWGEEGCSQGLRPEVMGTV